MKPGAGWRRWGHLGLGPVRSWLRIEVIPVGGGCIPEPKYPASDQEATPGAAMKQRLECWLECPWPRTLDLPWERLQPLHGDAKFLGTPGIQESLFALTGEPGPWGLDLGLAAGTAMVGFFGHGLNSYAFYLLLRQPGLLVHLRLSFGGLYSNPGRDRDEIRDYLQALDTFLRATESYSTLRVACEGIDNGWYLRRGPDTQRATFSGRLRGRPDFSPLREFE